MDIGTTAVGFYSVGERWGSTPNTAQAKEQGGCEWMENYYEETSGIRAILAKLT